MQPPQQVIKHWLNACQSAFAFKPETDFLINPFLNSSTLKQRIIMLQQSKTNRWALVKYGAVAALTTAVVVFIAACEDQSKKDIVQQESVTANTAAKTKTISGRILAPDGKPLPGASIELKNGTRGTSTDANGNFIFSNVPDNATLVASFQGYPDTEFTMLTRTISSGKAAVSIVMSPNNKPNSLAITLGTNPESAQLAVKQATAKERDDVFLVVENQAEFPGGTPALFEWMGKNIRYPEAAVRAKVSGRVFLSFIVTTDGSIEDVKVMKGLGFGMDEEAKRIVATMPKWKPGRQGGQAVNSRYNLPINFVLEE